MNGRFIVPGTVHATPDDSGNLVLLNRATGNWHVLNRTGAEFFEALRAHEDLDAATESLTSRHPDVPAEQIRRDVDLLVAALVSRGLLEPEFHRRAAGVLMTLPSPTRSVTWGQRVAALIAFPLALVLLWLPFRITTAAVARLKNWLCRRQATVAEAQGALAAARRAGRLHPGRVACLEESLTAVLASAMLGRRVDWCFGFGVDPRTFHAWIAVNGNPVTGNADDPIQPTYRQVLLI